MHFMMDPLGKGESSRKQASYEVFQLEKKVVNFF